MDHLPYIIPAYAIAILIPAGFGILTTRRLRLARRRLAQLETRKRNR